MKVMNIGIIIRNDHDDTFPVALTPQMVSIIQNLLTQIPATQSKLVDSAGKPVVSKASIPIIPRCMEFDWDTAYAPIMPEEELKMMKALQDKYTEAEKNRPPETEASDGAKEGGIIVPEGMCKDEDDPEGKVTKLGMMQDVDNPFNMELNASGRANVDLEEGENTDAAETAGAEVPVDQAKAAKEAGLELDKQTGEEEDRLKTPDLAASPATECVTQKLDEEVREMEDGIEKASEGECSGDCTVTPDALNISGEQKSI